MTTPSQKLADSLDALKALQERGVVAIRGKDLSRIHRERLQKNGFLQEVMKGWYIPCRPQASVGQNIVPFTDFLARLVEQGQRGKPLSSIPRS